VLQQSERLFWQSGPLWCSWSDHWSFCFPYCKKCQWHSQLSPPRLMFACFVYILVLCLKDIHSTNKDWIKKKKCACTAGRVGTSKQRHHRVALLDFGFFQMFLELDQGCWTKSVKEMFSVHLCFIRLELDHPTACLPLEEYKSILSYQKTN